MSNDEIVFNEHLIKISKWKRLKLWLWHFMNRKRISIWVNKEEE